jgi:5,10-methylene-tetrahydrofolate dehydrogenase/methenyl tetrahydrofolate cyclohydrolase
VAAGALISSQYSLNGLGYGRALGTGAIATGRSVAMCDASAGGAAGGARIISGKEVALEIKEEVRLGAEALKREFGVTPGLAVVVVGNRTDSATYVRAKKSMAEAVGFLSIDCKFDADVSEREVMDCVTALNEDPRVHAILVQLPLPPHINEHKIVSAVAVAKDVDGFSADNIGNLALRGGRPPLAVPCTPAGCVELLQRSGVDVRGKEAVVLGRSNIVGMPVAALLQSMDATVTVCHSHTKDIEAHVRRADILVAALGKPEYVRGEWLKPGCVVIDVGINSKPDASAPRGYRLVGDVDFESASKVAGETARRRGRAGGRGAICTHAAVVVRALTSAPALRPCPPAAGMITPVPGGVGPMTIVMLMKNTLNLARNSVGLERMPLRRAGPVK